MNPATPALSLKVNNSLGPIDTEVGEPLLGTYTSNVDVTNCSAGPGFSQYQPDTTLTPTSAKAGTINNALAHRTSSPSTSPQDFDYTLSCR